MAFTKTEVNFMRLLASAPHQHNQAKLVHYVVTLRELLENLMAETTAQGLPRISKAKVNDYSEKIEGIAARLGSPMPSRSESSDVIHTSSLEETPQTEEVSSPSGLRRRLHRKLEAEEHDIAEKDTSMPVRLDTLTQTHIERHRKLQEDLTDEMVELAQQLKEGSLMMSQSLRNTEKILDSTEGAVEHSLASTGHANVQAVGVYSEGSRTTCLTLLLIFVMTCIFVMVVLLIRVT